MKKFTTLFTTALIGLSANIFSQTNTTSYSDNNDSKLGTNNLFLGQQSGNINSSGNYNVYSGYRAGYSNSTGSWNTFTGGSAGQANIGNHNVFTGNGAGYGWSNITHVKNGSRNTFSGYRSGFEISTGNDNVAMGYASGFHNSEGIGNVFTGRSAGYNNETGDYNVAIGNNAGFRNVAGSNNVFIGRTAGFNETSSNKLYIDNSSTTTPLIYGDFATNKLTFNGKVSTGIGNTSFPTTTVSGTDISHYTLFVAGGLLSEEVRIRTDWADYVFKDSYKLKSLNEVENFINTNGHLPNVPSAKEVEASGIEMGEITKIQQEKIEELTLYIIEQNKRLEQQNTRIEALEAKMSNK